MSKEDVFAYGQRLKDSASAFAYDNSDQIYVVGVTALIIGVCLFLFSRFKSPGEEKVMKKEAYILGKRQQKQRENNLIADGVAAILLDLSAKGELTPERYKYWHLRFGTQLAMKDLLPAKLEPKQVKEAMRKRIGNGVYKPVNFPKETKERKAKNALDAILNKTV